MAKKYSLIAACDVNGDNKLPWHIPADLKYFAEITKNSSVIVGRTTYENMPPLKGRNTLVVSKSLPFAYASFAEALEAARGPTFVIGGTLLYAATINNCHKIYLTRIAGSYETDTKFPPIPPHFNLISATQQDNLTFCVYENTRSLPHAALRDEDRPLPNSGEYQYLSALRAIIKNPPIAGRNGLTRSIFGLTHSYDLTRGFPLFTIKYTPFNVIADELLFFIRGDTDTNKLSSKIWAANTSAEFLKSRNLPYPQGFMGPMYGYNWRHFGAPYVVRTPKEGGAAGFDQLAALIRGLREDPNGRRHLLTTYNPAVVAESVLAPCHGLITQFNVENGRLSCFTYQRSADMALGYPFNVASYALLLHIIAHLCGYTPHMLHISLGNAHLYESHNIEPLLSREPLPPPQLKILRNFSLDDIKIEDFEIINYTSHKKIFFKMVA